VQTGADAVHGSPDGTTPPHDAECALTAPRFSVSALQFSAGSRIV